jgi:hypothetical protein
MSDRTLHLTSPLMHGGDVVGLQHAVNSWLDRWQVPRRLECDGVYGSDSRRMSLIVCYGLGIASADTARGVTPAIRLKLRDAQRLTMVERRRLRARAQWRARLRQRFALHGAELAVAYALRMAARGVHEIPGRENRGPLIDKWNRMVGTPPGPQAFWCGAFCNACLVAAGFTSMPFMKSCPQIEQHARGGVDGWRFRPPSASPRAGWLALFTEGTQAGHVELVVKPGFPLQTVGGNTSPMHGSPNNGGGVYRHDFSVYRGLPLRGFAVPPYHD